MSDQSIQFQILDAVVSILGGNAANVWRVRFRNFDYRDLPAINVIPEDEQDEYQDTDSVERHFRFHVRHLTAAKDDAGAPLDGADRAADQAYLAAYKLLFADRTLGGLVRIIREVGQKWEMEGATLNTIAKVVTYEVQYSTQIKDPTLPGY
jgi:hypothetical protein